MNALALSAEDVCVSFGDKRVVKGLNLAASRGEILALLGANGAGKTTLISALTGLRKPTAGRVSVFGNDPFERTTRSSFGVMLQDCDLPPSFRVGELIEFFRRLYAAPLPLPGILKMANLAGLESTQVGKLSGGQRQRVKFALAVAGDPQLLFLDEPTVAMDAESRRQFLASLREMASRGKSVFLTTHYLEDVDAVATRIAIMHDGAIMTSGTPAEIKASVGGKLVQFRGAHLTPEALRRLPGVSDVQNRQGLWSLQTSHAENCLRELLRPGPEIADLIVRPFGLEEALLSLTSAANKEVAL